MLAEWIRNVPIALIRQIMDDRKARGTRIWILASEEFQRRRSGESHAA